jgi:hypothetical protein
MHFLCSPDVLYVHLIVNFHHLNSIVLDIVVIVNMKITTLWDVICSLVDWIVKKVGTYLCADLLSVTSQMTVTAP